MTKGRLEAFTDGVVAILITIMVLELKVPHGPGLEGLREVYPTLLSYLLSFVYLGIYWNNHHHMMHAAKHVDGGVMWANLHLLFWLSLVPFATRWMDESGFAAPTVGIYGVNLLLCGVAYAILSRSLVRVHGTKSEFARRLGKDFKGNASLLIYTFAVAVAHWLTSVSLVCYVAVALMWVVPDRRFAYKPEEVADES